MANRTTTPEVKKILPADVSIQDVIIDSIIEDANGVVTDILGDDTTLSDVQKESIEKWLAAHFIMSTVERQAQKEGVDGANITYTGKTGMGLDSTTYGQIVKSMDTTGKMSQDYGKKQAKVYAIPSTNKNRFK